jgi:hypothetical protein
MNKAPNALWAVIIITEGVILALAVLFRPEPVNIALAVLTIGSNIVSGALGFLSGHIVGAASTSISAPNSTISNETGGGFPPKGDK